MDNPTPRSNSKLTKGQRTAKQILEAAARCIQKVGVEKTSVTNIALEAQLKRSLIAYHFPKKAEIFYRVIVHIFEEAAFNRSEYTAGLHGRKRLEELMRSYVEFFTENSHYFNCFLYFHYLASIQDKYRQLSDTIHLAINEQTKICISEMLEENEITSRRSLLSDFSELLYHRLIGSILSYYTTNHDMDLSQYKDQYNGMLGKEIDLFLHYAKTNPGEIG